VGRTERQARHGEEAAGQAAGAPLILLDTHVLLWAVAYPSKLSKDARREVERALGAGGTSVAAITLFELASLSEARRIQLPAPLPRGLEDVIAEARATVHPLTFEIAAEAARLPPVVSDPMDRMIAATALVHGLSLVTKDATLLGFKQLKTIW
jgi:PIN domain nuclease of toxin-antitoxin system